MGKPIKLETDGRHTACTYQERITVGSRSNNKNIGVRVGGHRTKIDNKIIDVRRAMNDTISKPGRGLTKGTSAGIAENDGLNIVQYRALETIRCECKNGRGYVLNTFRWRRGLAT